MRAALRRQPPSAARVWSPSRSAPTRDGPRVALIALSRPLGHLVERRLRMVGAVARQGFELCEARERPARAADAAAIERPLEPLIPGFLCASATMSRLVDQIKRLQGNQLTVLITGESGTGKELVARAIHAGSPRAVGDVPPVQLHDDDARSGRQPAVRPPARQLHRRGDRSAGPDPLGRRRARCSSTRSATCRWTSSRSCCGFSSRARSCRSARRGRIRWTCACWPPPTPTSNSASAEGRFREDLYYRLSVIRHARAAAARAPRRDPAPHAASSCARRCDELNKPDVELSPAVLDLFAQYMWPGNVRQLRNEIKRAVALSRPARPSRPRCCRPSWPALDARDAGQPGVGRRATPAGRHAGGRRRPSGARPDPGSTRSEPTATSPRRLASSD